MPADSDVGFYGRDETLLALDRAFDDKQIVHYRGPTLYAGQGCYLKLANYHTPVGKPVSVVHARVRRGPTREALGSGALP